MEIARAHPLVLADPPPHVVFLRLGGANDLSMDFSLRVYVASLDHMLQARNEITGRIAALFAERGIHLAAPQREVHIRRMARPPRPTADPTKSFSPGIPAARWSHAAHVSKT